MANRWPPYIETRIASTARIVVNAVGAPQALTGMTVTVTPKVASRFAISAVFDVEHNVYVAGAIFLASLYVGGVQRAAPFAIWNPPALAGRLTIPCATHTEDVAAGVATTFDFRVQQIVAAATWTVYEFGHTAMTLIAMPSEGIAY